VEGSDRTIPEVSWRDCGNTTNNYPACPSPARYIITTWNIWNGIHKQNFRTMCIATCCNIKCNLTY